LKRSARSAPRRFIFLFIIAERFFEMPNYLGGLLEHSLKLRLIYLDYILSQTILYFPQSLLHFPDMVAQITSSYTNHLKLLICRYDLANINRFLPATVPELRPEMEENVVVRRQQMC
jgi:hypothetical protein